MFDPKQGTKEDWNQAFRFRKELHDEITPNEPYLPDEAWKHNLLVQLDDDTMDLVLFVARVNDEIAGIANIVWFLPKSSGYEENKHTGFCSVEVLPRYRQQGLAKQLLSRIYPVVQDHDIQTLIGGTIEEASLAFIKAIGGQEALANIDNRLVFSEIDWKMVEEWAEIGRKRNPNTSIEEFDIVPDHRMAAFVKAFDSTLRQVPTGDMDMTMTINEAEIRQGEEKRQKTGKTQIKLVTVEPDESISGLTWLTFNPNLPTVLYQGLTGVMENQRGRGLGKWLKAETLLRARDRYNQVKYIKTDNATTNAPMISINERLGFREFRRNYNLQLSLSALGQYLE